MRLVVGPDPAVSPILGLPVVLLGFTPFGYDGVNQYALEHPELKAVGKDGKKIDKLFASEIKQGRRG